MNAAAVRKLLAKACEAHRAIGGQKAWAKINGLSAAYVSDVLNGRREPGETICKALGIERVISYRLAELGLSSKERKK